MISPVNFQSLNTVVYENNELSDFKLYESESGGDVGGTNTENCTEWNRKLDPFLSEIGDENERNKREYSNFNYTKSDIDE